jgi:N-acetylneuraminic acid mutarotase
MQKQLLALFCLLVVSFHAQDYVWIKGPTSGSVAGTYGTKGTATITNNPGGRSGAAYWKDNNGNYWMFGGEGFDFFANQGLLSDLWKYDPQNNTWTWMAGPDVINQKGKYGSAGTFSNTFNPGGRFGAAAWTDANGDLWLFGGYGIDTSNGQGYLNDLWKYSISQNKWAFMGGTKGLFQPGIYTTISVPSATIYPGARRNPTFWGDANGNFYLFGGLGNTTSANNVGMLHDLWKFNPANSQWTWLHGSQYLDQHGYYGTMGVSSPTTMPGSRQGGNGWTDNLGNIWLFGGFGYDFISPTTGLLSDIWRYEPTTNVWTWMQGSNQSNQPGVYSQTGVPSTTNTPGARAYSFTWKDPKGKLWLFGGEAFGSSSLSGNINDLWQFNPSNMKWMWVRGNNNPGQNGQYGSLNMYAPTNTPGGRNSICGWMDAKGNFALFGGQGHPASGSSAKLSDLWLYRNCHIDSLNIAVTTNSAQICAGEGATLTATGGSLYAWSHNSVVTGSTVYASPATTSVFAASADNANGCTYTGTVNLIVNPCTGINSVDSPVITIYPNPSQGEFTIVNPIGGEMEIQIFTLDGKSIEKLKVSDSLPLTLPPGVYLVTTTLNEKVTHQKIIIQ